MTVVPAVATTTLRVAVLAYPEVDELDLFGAYAVLSKARLIAESCGAAPVETWIAAPAAAIVTSGGASVTAHEGLGTCARADAVVVPGGRGAIRAAEDAALRDVLRQAADGGARLYCVCSGSIIVAAAGLAVGRRMAVHTGKRDRLMGYGTRVAEGGMARDGQLCSVGGDRRPSVKSVDLAFLLLADFRPELSEPIAVRMEIEQGRTTEPAAGVRA